MIEQGYRATEVAAFLYCHPSDIKPGTSERFLKLGNSDKADTHRLDGLALDSAAPAVFLSLSLSEASHGALDSRVPPESSAARERIRGFRRRGRNYQRSFR